MTIPPGGVLLSVRGLRGSDDHASVRGAIRGRDPAAHVDADWPRGLIIVQSDHPPEALRLAVQDAGFITAWLPHPPREVTARGAMATAMRILGLGFAGLVVGTLLGGVAALALIALDPRCGGPGDSGGCAMGIPAFAIGAGLLGAAAGLALGVVRAIRRR
ncbi:hypothetical protein AAFN86_02505 [Roseomonas sp. CAU 1739]|uniref:hypothetical protein n=1 Tax=Roseomonas sp. CAU 1739 TaxID=3140364 RepID=UPI00325BA82D